MVTWVPMGPSVGEKDVMVAALAQAGAAARMANAAWLDLDEKRIFYTSRNMLRG